MKKILITGILILSLVGLVFAAQGGGSSANDGSGAQYGNLDSGEGTQFKLMKGEYANEAGQQMQVQEMANNRIRLNVGGVSTDCDCELTQEIVQNRTRLKMKLSNGQNAEVKIMPDVASERALERLRLKVCSEENGCSIELKEVAQGKEVKAVYELKTQRQSKVFGIFQRRMHVQAQVDSETGEIIRTKKPWWAFLATEPKGE